MVAALENARPDFVRRNLGQLPVESALLRVPAYALGAAWANVSLEEWIAYLRAAPSTIRDRAVAACPARLREALTEELALRVAVDPGLATSARRKIVRAALHAAPTAGNGVGNGATGRPMAVEDEETGIMESPEAKS